MARAAVGHTLLDVAVLALAVLALSFLLLVSMIVMLVVMRRGEAPPYRPSRDYDANRREAARVLLAGEIDHGPAEQWYDRRRKVPAPDDPLAGSYRDVVADALAAVGPRDLAWEDGAARIEADDAWVVPALSTADLRALGIERWDGRGRLTIGIVLFNPEPPGDDARRVALPVQILFPALARAGRDDLVRQFQGLMQRARDSIPEGP